MDDLSKLREIAACFDVAEQNLKEVEHLTNRVVIPAVNELRYAGHHALKAIDASTPQLKEEMFDKAKRHCARAGYDVLEIGAAAHLKTIQVFQKDFRLYPLAGAVSGYVQYLRDTKEAIEFLSKNSGHSENPDWEGIKERFTKVKEIALTLEAARPEINKSMRLWQVTITVAAVSAMAGVATLILRILSSL